MSNRLKQKLAAWGVVLFVMVCVVGHIVERMPTADPTVEETALSLLDDIDDMMVHPQSWWSDKTLSIYFIEVSNQLRRPCTPAERVMLETRLNHYYNMMVERGII